MWTVSEDASCGEGTPYGVVQDGEVDSCYATTDEAQARCDELNADSGDATVQERAIYAVLAVEGVDTGDGRMLDVGGWRDDRTMPLPLMVQSTSTHGGYEPGPSQLGGRWDTIERMADGRRLYATGHLNIGSEQGASWAADIEAGNLRFVSIDAGDVEVEYEVRVVEDDGWPVDVLAHFTEYSIMGATLVPFPALNLAVVWLDGMDAPAEFTQALPDVPDRVDEPEVVPATGYYSADPVVAGGARQRPSVDAFDLQATELTPLTITERDEQGWRRVYGHIAPWGTCHTGIPEACVTAPESPSGYAYFRTGATLAECCTDCGSTGDLTEVPTGVLTMNTMHAARGLGMADTAAHYEHTGTAMADVAAGQDDFGPWIAGVIRDDVSDEDVEVLRGSSPSGDWRRIGGALELVAVLAVNVPGFPVVRASAHLDDSGRTTALIAPFDPRSLSPHGSLAASGATPRQRNRQVLDAAMQQIVPLSPLDHGRPVVVVPKAEYEALQRRVAVAEATTRALGPQAAAALAERVHPTS